MGEEDPFAATARGLADLARTLWAQVRRSWFDALFIVSFAILLLAVATTVIGSLICNWLGSDLATRWLSPISLLAFMWTWLLVPIKGARSAGRSADIPSRRWLAIPVLVLWYGMALFLGWMAIDMHRHPGHWHGSVGMGDVSR